MENNLWVKQGNIDLGKLRGIVDEGGNIVISGETGTGKTELKRLLVDYLSDEGRWLEVDEGSIEEFFVGDKDAILEIHASSVKEVMDRVRSLGDVKRDLQDFLGNVILLGKNVQGERYVKDIRSFG